MGGNFTSTLATIGGVLHAESGATIGSGVTSASVVREPIAVVPPCPCDANQLVPITAIVDAAKTSNDNALIGLDATVFEGGTTQKRLDLPCGRYFLTKIDASQSGQMIAVHGRTAIFVEGDIVNAGGFWLQVDPTAEVDLFVGGKIDNSAGLYLGSPSYPALTRLYVAGGAPGFGGVIGANVYLLGDTDSGNGNELYGSLFVQHLTLGGGMNIHYDTAVTKAGKGCGGSASGCTSCMDCGNQACIGGTCGACTKNSDCCSPLQCVGGECVSVIL